MLKEGTEKGGEESGEPHNVHLQVPAVWGWTLRQGSLHTAIELRLYFHF